MFNEKKEPKLLKKEEIDLHIGGKLRELRKLRGITQTEIADFLNLTFQQVQKYEKGTNRMSAGTVKVLADFLGVDVLEFFDCSESVKKVDKYQYSIIKNLNRISSDKDKKFLSQAAQFFAGRAGNESSN